MQVDLRTIAEEAAGALARLDVARLEEMALSCQALNRELRQFDIEARRTIEPEAKAARREMDHFACVLEKTRRNLSVLSRSDVLEYGRRRQ